MGKGRLAFILLTVVFSFSAAAAQEFLPYEGKNAIHDGEGGNRKTVNGIDFWTNGDPPKRYQVIGAITDERHKTGLIGLFSMSNLERDIAKAAKDNGGDAVILTDAKDEVTGVVGTSYGSATGSATGGMATAQGFGSGFARPVKEHESRYLVVKYLADTAPSAPAQTPAPAGQAQ